VTLRHISAVRTLNAVDRIRDLTGGLEARMNQKELKQNFKGIHGDEFVYMG